MTVFQNHILINFRKTYVNKPKYFIHNKIYVVIDLNKFNLFLSSEFSVCPYLMYCEKKNSNTILILIILRK